MQKSGISSDSEGRIYSLVVILIRNVEEGLVIYLKCHEISLKARATSFNDADKERKQSQQLRKVKIIIILQQEVE